MIQPIALWIGIGMIMMSLLAPAIAFIPGLGPWLVAWAYLLFPTGVFLTVFSSTMNIKWAVVAVIIALIMLLVMGVAL